MAFIVVTPRKNASPSGREQNRLNCPQMVVVQETVGVFQYGQNKGEV
jgi:hypothetical protein